MSNTRNFSGKVVLITGSSSGIGAEAAIEFSRLGANVAITGRNDRNLSSVAQQVVNVSPKGLKPLQVVADISKPEDCNRLIDETIKSFGKLDVLVNNAGRADACSSVTDPDILNKYQNQMDTDLRSVIYLTHLSVKHLEKTKGNIINISSVAGLKPVSYLINLILFIKITIKTIDVNNFPYLYLHMLEKNIFNIYATILLLLI